MFSIFKWISRCRVKIPKKEMQNSKMPKNVEFKNAENRRRVKDHFLPYGRRKTLSAHTGLRNIEVLEHEATAIGGNFENSIDIQIHSLVSLPHLAPTGSSFTSRSSSWSRWGKEETYLAKGASKTWIFNRRLASLIKLDAMIALLSHSTAAGSIFHSKLSSTRTARQHFPYRPSYWEFERPKERVRLSQNAEN